MIRSNAVRFARPFAGAALFALACGGEFSDSEPTEEIPIVDVERDTCEDNPLLAGCSEPEPAVTPPGGGDAPAEVPVDTTSELELARASAENVLRANCGQCHGPDLTPAAARAGMNFIDDIDALVNEGKIQPLDSESSPVVRRMRDGSMPPLNSNGPRPSTQDIELVADFVDNPLFWPEYRAPESCEGQFISFDDLYAQLQDDLREFDRDDRERIRYVTLTNRYNAGVCGDAMDRERFAIVKLLNMVSTRPFIRVPEPIDRDQLIYRIDIRDFGWDRDVNGFNDGWEAIIAESPYAVPFVGDDADDLRDDTGTDVPVMYADALIDVASLGDVYYGLIGIEPGQSLQDFIENDLGIDVQDNIDDGDAVRAGTTRSAISREDRVVERHEIGVRQGVYWQSFDFAAGQDGGSIFADPFGFNQGGTEAIFSLPNGLLGFIIADDNDDIVGETNLLLDTFQDDFVVRTSVSCSNCHAQGFNMVEDEVGPFVRDNRFRIQRDDFEAVNELYVEPAEFAEIIQEDSELYQQALRGAGLPVTGPDPVARTFQRFNLDLTLADAAGELGVTPEELGDLLNLLDPRLAVLRATTIDRDDFTDVFEESLCILQIVSQNQPDPDRCN